MSIITKYKREDFENILSNYSIGQYKSHKHVSWALQNTIYFVRTTKGKYVLKNRWKIFLNCFRKVYILTYVLVFLSTRYVMVLKQISLTIPEMLLKESTEYYRSFGYRNIQEFIVDLIRRKVVFENTERYAMIEKRMKQGRGVKKFDQKSAIDYIRGL